MKATLNHLIDYYDLEPVYNEDTEDDPCINNMAIAYPTIWIGEYDNDEYHLLSFFHEIGHTIITQGFIKDCKYNTLLVEIECWRLGIIEAQNNHGILFSDEAIQWGYNKAMSYVGHDEREDSSYAEFKKPTLWVNRKGNK